MLRFNPPAYFVLGLFVSIGSKFLWPAFDLLDWPYRWIGVIFVAAGAWITIWADAVFKRLKTTVKPQEQPSTLVNVGPFKLSRHPMYLGMTAILIGTALFLGSLGAFVGPFLFWLIMQVVFIPYEESKMTAAFGSTYQEYRKRTRMWI